jgi:hypothetical protein
MQLPWVVGELPWVVNELSFTASMEQIAGDMRVHDAVLHSQSLKLSTIFTVLNLAQWEIAVVSMCMKTGSLTGTLLSFTHEVKGLATDRVGSGSVRRGISHQ